jgi:hypothetical protein
LHCVKSEKKKKKSPIDLVEVISILFRIRDYDTS